VGIGVGGGVPHGRSPADGTLRQGATASKFLRLSIRYPAGDMLRVVIELFGGACGKVAPYPSTTGETMRDTTLLCLYVLAHDKRFHTIGGVGCGAVQPVLRSSVRVG